MEWKDIGDAVAKVAPVAANILTGNIPGAIANVGSLIASALGVEADPAAVQAAIAADSAALERIRQMELTHARDMAALSMQAQANELAAHTARMGEINATMRTEAQSDKWWVSGWRPFWGFISALAFAIVAALVCWLGFQAVASSNQEAMRMVPDLVSAMALLFGIPGAILGVASWHRGQEKRQRVGLARKDGAG